MLQSPKLLKQEWIVFSTSIASELQLPIELRRDGLWMIKRNKDTYLDLLKTEIEIPENIKKTVANELPHPTDLKLDVMSLPRIMIDICNSELVDMKSANARNRDRYSQRTAALVSPQGSNINTAFPTHVTLDVGLPTNAPTTAGAVPPVSSSSTS